MLQLFKKERPVNEVIEEIHDNFYTEVDRLLADAKISRSLDTDKQSLIDKCARLKALGFTNTKEVKEAEVELARIEAIRKENETKTELIEAIHYFSAKYPNYKFITEDSVRKICEKYNLVYGAINKYIGTVPDKNLKHIEEFKVHEDDECHMQGRRSDFMLRRFFDSPEFVNVKYYSVADKRKAAEKKEAEYAAMSTDELAMRRYIEMGRFVFDIDDVDMRLPLEIAAPLSDFNMTDAEVKNFKISNIEIPDPVVLKPVVFKKQKYYLIITAWGNEASDELVVNQRYN